MTGAVLMLSGCAGGAVSEAALCAGTEAATTEHAAALADDSGTRAQETGRTLIQLLDAGCNRP